MSENLSFIREIACGGKTLQVKQLYEGDVGCVVWDAALVLCRLAMSSSHMGTTIDNISYRIYSTTQPRN